MAVGCLLSPNGGSIVQSARIEAYTLSTSQMLGLWDQARKNLSALSGHPPRWWARALFHMYYEHIERGLVHSVEIPPLDLHVDQLEDSIFISSIPFFADTGRTRA